MGLSGVSPETLCIALNQLFVKYKPVATQERKHNINDTLFLLTGNAVCLKTNPYVLGYELTLKELAEHAVTVVFLNIYSQGYPPDPVSLDDRA